MTDPKFSKLDHAMTMALQDAEAAQAAAPSTMAIFAVSKVCGALDRTTIGTKVVAITSFTTALDDALKAHDRSKDPVPGQHFVMLPNAVHTVSGGIGTRDGRTADDYVVRMHRGRCDAFLKRQFAAKPTGLAVIVYTIDAYAADPEVDAEEVAGFRRMQVTHVIVAVLAFAGPRAPLSPYRFVSNLAGGNNEADTWTLEQIRSMARDIKSYDDAWCVVAD